jgi:hypothetical protein
MAFEIKQEYQSTVVGFNNSGLPLGKRGDLHLLAEMALHADGTVKNAYLISMFEQVPTLEEIKAAKEENFNNKQAVKKSKRNARQNADEAQ